MEQLHNGFTLDTSGGSFPLSTDSILLSHFAKLPRQAKVLDLGSGCGTLGVLLCAKDASCHVTGIELDPQAHEVALENIARNGLQERMKSICADLRSLSEEIAPGQFQVCISNPPYFSGGPASATHRVARREDHCTTADLCNAAARALKYGGDFFVVHKPEKLAHLIACAAACGLEAKRLLLVRHKEGSEISLILLSFRKGGKPGLQVQELYLHNSDGSPSADYKQIYHIP